MTDWQDLDTLTGGAGRCIHDSTGTDAGGAGTSVVSRGFTPICILPVKNTA